MIFNRNANLTLSSGRETVLGRDRRCVSQRSVATERRWSDPYFLGALIVLGDS